VLAHTGPALRGAAGLQELGTSLCYGAQLLCVLEENPEAQNTCCGRAWGSHVDLTASACPAVGRVPGATATVFWTSTPRETPCVNG
jgi:hypothetical protein